MFVRANDNNEYHTYACIGLYLFVLAEEEKKLVQHAPKC